MLVLTVLIFISIFTATESSVKEYAIIEQMQKYNPQKCMHCPELNLTQTCGFINDSMAFGFLVNEKKPVPCGKQYINYHTYWSKQTCAKAIIRCSTDQYKYTYVYGEKLFNDTLTNETRNDRMSFLSWGLNKALGTFICNENGQWQHVDEEFWTPLMMRKRKAVKENISCLFSNYLMFDSDAFSHTLFKNKDEKKLKMTRNSSSTPC